MPEKNETREKRHQHFFGTNASEQRVCVRERGQEDRYKKEKGAGKCTHSTSITPGNGRDPSIQQSSSDHSGPFFFNCLRKPKVVASRGHGRVDV